MQTMDQASQRSAQKRTYHRMIFHEDGDGGRRSHSHKVTALDARGIDSVRVENNMWYVEDPSLNRPPDGGWDKAFQAKGQPLPRSWNCDNVLDSSKSYVSTRPDDTKDSIPAAAALVYLYDRHELPLAGNAWQTQALKPHSIIKRAAPQGSSSAGSSLDSAAHGESMFFVIARGAYAARVCPVQRVAEDLLALNFYHWSWLVVTHVQDTAAENACPASGDVAVSFVGSCAACLLTWCLRHTRKQMQQWAGCWD